MVYRNSKHANHDNSLRPDLFGTGCDVYRCPISSWWWWVLLGLVFSFVVDHWLWKRMCQKQWVKHGEWLVFILGILNTTFKYICVWDYIFNSWVLWWCSSRSWNYQPLSQSPNPTNEQGQICFVVVELMSSKWLPAVIAKLVGPPARYLSWCNKLVNPAKLNKHAYLKGGHLVFFYLVFQMFQRPSLLGTRTLRSFKGI